MTVRAFAQARRLTASTGTLGHNVDIPGLLNRTFAIKATRLFRF